MFKTAKDYFEMSKCECFSQEILFVLFLLINTNQTFNIHSLFVGINIDKQIKHVCTVTKRKSYY